MSPGERTHHEQEAPSPKPQPSVQDPTATPGSHAKSADTQPSPYQLTRDEKRPTTEKKSPEAMCTQDKTGPEPKPSLPSKEEPRLLLDVFSGIHAPISQAAMEMGLDRF